MMSIKTIFYDDEECLQSMSSVFEWEKIENCLFIAQRRSLVQEDLSLKKDLMITQKIHRLPILQGSSTNNTIETSLQSWNANWFLHLGIYCSTLLVGSLLKRLSKSFGRYLNTNPFSTKHESNDEAFIAFI